jgi:hypothetical protein
MGRQQPTISEKTDITRWLPSWVLNEKKQKAVALIAGGLAALATGVWAILPPSTPKEVYLKVDNVWLSEPPFMETEQDRNYTLFVHFRYQQKGYNSKTCTGRVRTQTAESAVGVRTTNIPNLIMENDGSNAEASFRFDLYTSNYKSDAYFQLRCSDGSSTDWIPIKIKKPEPHPFAKARRDTYGTSD